MQTVRLKFFVAEHKQATFAPGNASTGSVVLRPVTSGSEENKAFYAYTPGGQLEFVTVNEAAIAALPIGAEVYVDLTPIRPVQG